MNDLLHGPKAAPAAKRLGEMVAGIRLPEKGNPRHDALEALTAMGEAAHPALGHLFTAAQYDGEHSVAEPTVNLIVTLGKKDPRLRTWLVGFFSESKETELSLASFNAMSTTMDHRRAFILRRSARSSAIQIIATTNGPSQSRSWLA